MILKNNIRKLVLDEEKATYIGSVDFRCLEINYIGSTKIVTLLPQNYIVKKSHNKIYIFNIGNIRNIVESKTENMDLDLFKYKGKALFTRAKITNRQKIQGNVFISRQHIQVWKSLFKRDDVEYDWAYLDDKWEDIDFDGKNNKQSYIHRHIDKDEEANTTTITREIRKK